MWRECGESVRKCGVCGRSVGGRRSRGVQGGEERPGSPMCCLLNSQPSQLPSQPTPSLPIPLVAIHRRALIAHERTLGVIAKATLVSVTASSY